MSYADRDKYGMYKGSTSMGPGPAQMGADTLIGDSVVNAQDESLGEIKEIMLDMNTGQVSYAVLSFGGFLGMGEKLFAVPWQALHLDTVNKRFMLNVDKERLQNAPGFDPDAWPDMADTTWMESIHTFYGTDPHRVGGPSMGPGMAGSMHGGMSGAGAGAGMGGGMGAAMGSSMGAGAAGSAGEMSSGSGAGMSSGAGGSAVGSGSMGGSSGLGAGTGSGVGGDLGSSTAAGTSSGSRTDTSAGTGGSGTGPGSGKTGA